jgi:thiamine biosynthesis lipoprotein ApbE
MHRSSVTIVAKDCTTADAYAKGVSVLGPKKGIEVIDRLDGAAAFIVLKADGEPETHSSQRWKELRVESADSGTNAKN